VAARASMPSGSSTALRVRRSPPRRAAAALRNMPPKALPSMFPLALSLLLMRHAGEWLCAQRGWGRVSGSCMRSSRRRALPRHDTSSSSCLALFPLGVWLHSYTDLVVAPTRECDVVQGARSAAPATGVDTARDRPSWQALPGATRAPVPASPQLPAKACSLLTYALRWCCEAVGRAGTVWLATPSSAVAGTVWRLFCSASVGAYHT